MANLATTADLVARLGRALTAEETARAGALLADASGLIRSFTKLNFDHVTNDPVVLRPIGGYLRLPQRPVLAVHQVAIIDCDGQPGAPASGWCWDGSDKIRIAGGMIRGIDDPWWPWNSVPDALQVIYDHGYTTNPADAVAVCCRMVLAVLLAPTMTEGLVQERIGQYAYQYGQAAGQGSPGATVRMTDTDRDDLRHYRRTASTIQARVR